LQKTIDGVIDVYGWMHKEIFNSLTTLKYSYMATSLAPPSHILQLLRNVSIAETRMAFY
jgi:hypothetical protein